jgi:hypothetical protein
LANGFGLVFTNKWGGLRRLMLPDRRAGMQPRTE